MDDKTRDTVKVWAIGIAGAILAFFLIASGPINDPALPEVVYDKDGKPWTQDGERIEEDDPRWECTRDDDRCSD